MINVPDRLCMVLCAVLFAAKAFAQDVAAEAVDPAAATQSDLQQNAKESFYRVAKTMTPEDVFALLGAPTTSENRSSGKEFFIPFYFAGDTGRIIWTYAGVGTIYFSHNRYTERDEVIKVVPEKSK